MRENIIYCLRIFGGNVVGEGYMIKVRFNVSTILLKNVKIVINLDQKVVS